MLNFREKPSSIKRKTTSKPKMHIEASVSRCRHSTRRSLTKMAEMTCSVRMKIMGTRNQKLEVIILRKRRTI